MTVNRKMTKLLLIIVLLATVVFPVSVFAEKGDINSIEFESSAKLDLVVGQTPKQLKVFANVEGSSSKRDVTGAMTWKTSNADAVQVMNGLLTPLSSGTAIITATYNSMLTTIEVSVTHPFKDLKIEHKEGNYKLGDSEEKRTIKATVLGGKSITEATDVTKDVEWSSSDTSVLTISDGKVNLLKEGKVTITAKYKGLTATYKTEVEVAFTEIEIKQNGKIVKEIETLIGDSSIKLTAFSKTAAVSDSEDLTTNGDWSSSNPAVATVKDGELKVLATGKTVITITNLGVKATVDIYVRSPYEAILLSPSKDQTLFMGEVLDVKAEVRDAANSTANVSQNATWTSSDQLVATAKAEADAADITAKGVGDSTIKAEYRGVSREIKVKVLPTITALSIEKTEQELFRGDTLGLPKVDGTKLDGSKIDLTQEVEWTSGNAEIALIKDGKIEGKSAGTVTLIGKIKEGGATASKADIRNKSVELKLTVQDKVLVLIGPEDNFVVVTGEEKAMPSVRAVMENGDERETSDKIKWEITGTNAVLKTSASGQTIKGLTKGSANLKGTYANKTITIPVTIEQKITKIVVEPASLDMNIKNSKTVKVTAYYSNGKTGNLSSSIKWESSNPGAATVTGSSVKAVAEGTTTLKGSYQGIDISLKVNVIPKLAKLTVNETRLQLAPGAKQTVVVTALYDTGKTVDVTGLVTWTNSKPSVAKWSIGSITGVAKGSTSFKGKFEGKTVTVSVTVK
ncbi:hypothetical protein A8L34_06470 [Bacillus sp. FJAT-27264]|uniref:Ig-like domain-containing protein n=1 Tax=Paenibacillus sp. (strain DSM 101736 / FJAT-27264) TaxID=1850362 RepID=UPI000807C061|nr:Ig-like domain-containing protein [Bacillus sp. FJAT-27264]OBZ19169.1 hypothetical protein A8L34_06470 [Bacillus sp. FJAT-27264]